MSRVITTPTDGGLYGGGSAPPFNPALVLDDSAVGDTTKTWSSAAWGDGTRDIIINTLEAQTLNIKTELKTDDPIADVNAAGAAAAQVGIRAVAPTGAAPNYQMVYETARAAWTAGQEGSEKVLALRADAPTQARALTWDVAAKELVSAGAGVNVYFVDPKGSDTNDGQTPESAFATIAAATAVAVSGQTIVLSANAFAESVTLPDGVNLRGVGASLTGSGTVLELGDGSCVRLAGVEATAGRAVNLNKAGGAARCFFNVVETAGTAEAFRSQAGSLDVVVGSVTTVDGHVVAETNADRVNITVSRIEVTGTGHVFRTQGGGKVTCSASEIICGTGYVFRSNAAGSATIDVSCARLEAANLSNIPANISSTLIASETSGALVEVGAGSVALMTPAGVSDAFSVGNGLAVTGLTSLERGNAVSTSDWIAAAAGPSSAAGNRVIMGTLQGDATIGAHNDALSAWADLHLQALSGRSVVVEATTLTSTAPLNVTATTASTSTATGSGVFAGGIGVAGAVNAGGSVAAAGISFDSGANTLANFIDTTAETLTYSGPCVSAGGGVNLVRVGPIVHLTFEFTVLAGNSVSSVLNVSAFSASFRPATAQHIPIILDPGTGVSVMGSVIVGTGGTMTIYPSPEADAGNQFLTAGVFGWNQQTITWNVAS